MRRYVVPSQPTTAQGSSLADGLVQPWENGDLTAPIMNQLPSYFRCTTQAIPSNPELQKKCCIPVAVIMEPGRVGKPPLLDYTNNAIPRCAECEAYLSCFCTLSPDKSSWSCSLCGSKNRFSTKYLKHFSSYQELSSSVYDMKAPHTYIQRPQITKSFLFLIDMSKEAVSSGFTMQFAKSIKSSLDVLPEFSSITIITYTKYVTIYDLNLPKQTKIMEPGSFVATPNYIALLSKCRKNIDKVLDNIANYSTEEEGNCYGSALCVASSALRVYGGIILASCCSRPSFGPYAIEDRFSEKEEDEVSLLHMPASSPATPKYNSLALKMNRRSISLHLFACSKTHCELTVAGMACGLTGGKCHLYRTFDPSLLHIDVFSTLSDKYRWNCSMKLRCSDGINIEATIGNVTNTNEFLFFPILASGSTLAFSLSIKKPVNRALFQAALLWSLGPTQRYIRIFNFSIPVSNDLSILSTSFDQAAVVAYLLKITTINILNVGGTVSRETLSSTVNSILQNTLDLHSFPFFAHSLLMNKIITDNRTILSDERMAVILNLRSASVPECMLFLYPKLINVENKQILRCRKESIQDGVFAFQEQNRIIIWAYPKAKEEQAKSFVTSEGKAIGIMNEIANEMMELTGRYLHIEYMPSDEGMLYMSNHLVEDSERCRFEEWFDGILTKKFTG